MNLQVANPQTDLHFASREGRYCSGGNCHHLHEAVVPRGTVLSTQNLSGLTLN